MCLSVSELVCLFVCLFALFACLIAPLLVYLDVSYFLRQQVKGNILVMLTLSSQLRQI